MYIPSLSRSLSLFLMMGLFLVGDMDAASAQKGRFPRRVSAPNGLGQPRSGTTVSGGVRSSANPDQQFCGAPLEQGSNFTAIIPASDSIIYTLNPDPLILVYLPSLPAGSSGTANLTIANAEGDLLGQSTLNLPREGELVAFSFPEELLPLEEQQFYQWSLQVACQERVGLDDPSVAGWLIYQADSMSEEASPESEMEPGMEPEMEPEMESEMEDYLTHIDGLSEAGYWLDAILETANLLNTVDSETRNTELMPRLEALLKQEDLETLSQYFLE